MRETALAVAIFSASVCSYPYRTMQTHGFSEEAQKVEKHFVGSLDNESQEVKFYDLSEKIDADFELRISDTLPKSNVYARRRTSEELLEDDDVDFLEFFDALLEEIPAETLRNIPKDLSQNIDKFVYG